MNNRGFTLLEMVVSLGIIAVVSVLLSQVFITSLRSSTKTEIRKDVKQNGDHALESMVRMIQNAQEVSSACSSTGTASSTAVVIGHDGGETTLGCSFDGTSTRIASTSASGTSYLTTNDVSLGGSSCTGSSLIFTCAGGAGIPTSITIAFDLAQSGVPAQAFEQSSESFQTTTTMRNVVE